MQSVTANVNNVTTGSTAVPLVAGSFTSPAGTSYGYRSALLSSNPAQADGAVTYTVNATDNVSNTSTNSGNGSVTFDTTAPTGTVAASGTSGSINLTSTSVTDGTGSGTASITYYRCTGTGTPCTTTTPISTPANWTSIGTSTTSIGNWPVAWDSTTVANGSYTIMGVLTDKIGNQGASGNKATVTVNNSYTFVVANPGTQTAGTASAASRSSCRSTARTARHTTVLRTPARRRSRSPVPATRRTEPHPPTLRRSASRTGWPHCRPAL